MSEISYVIECVRKDGAPFKTRRWLHVWFCEHWDTTSLEYATRFATKKQALASQRRERDEYGQPTRLRRLETQTWILEEGEAT